MGSGVCLQPDRAKEGASSGIIQWSLDLFTHCYWKWRCIALVVQVCKYPLVQDSMPVCKDGGVFGHEACR